MFVISFLNGHYRGISSRGGSFVIFATLVRGNSVNVCCDRFTLK